MMKLIFQELAEDDFNNIQAHMSDLMIDGIISTFVYKGVAPGTMYVSYEFKDETAKISIERDCMEFFVEIVAGRYVISFSVERHHISHIIIE